MRIPKQEGKLIIHWHSYALLVENKLIAFAHPEDFNNENVIGKLSLKNCQAIERGYDLDELADEIENKSNINSQYDLNSILSEKIGFRKGFQKALEILGDRRFTEEDVRKAMDRVWDWCEDEKDVDCSSMTELRDKHIQSLQQNEWEVEIITKPLQGEINGGTWIVGGTKRPKLDADGCLILKRTT